jgi:hypothetical protein
VQPDIHSIARSSGSTIHVAIFEDIPGNVIGVRGIADVFVFA